MVKHIYALRHAKAVAGSPEQEDHQRTLNPQGQDDARQMGEYFKSAGIKPDMVLCSDAQRTRQTLNLLEEGMGQKLPVQYLSKLYLASAGDIFGQVEKQNGDKAQSILVIGHNPGLHQFCMLLAQDGEEDAKFDCELNFPTAAMATIRVDVDDWGAVSPGSGYLTNYITPKHLPV